MEAVYKMNFDCGRMGNLEGVFVAKKEHVKYLTESGIQVYFGEVLGKHSEVYRPIEESDLTMITDDEKVISVIQEHGLSSGYDPFDYTYIEVDDSIDDETTGEYIERKIAN